MAPQRIARPGPIRSASRPMRALAIAAAPKNAPDAMPSRVAPSSRSRPICTASAPVMKTGSAPISATDTAESWRCRSLTPGTSEPSGSRSVGTARRYRRPPMRSFPFLDHPGPIPFAHRGGASEAPENSLPAFQHAIDLGYRYLETDVHATADGVLVAFHDDVLDRVTDHQGRIDELTWAEVSRARIDGREPIPLLEDILATWPEARVNIDPKPDAAVDAAHRGAAPHRADRPGLRRFVLRQRIDRVRDALGPDLCTAHGTRASSSGLIRAFQGEDVTFRSQAAQVPPRDHERPGPGQPRAGRGRPRPRDRRARVDDRRPRRDAVAARRRGRRDHDRPARGPARGVRGARDLALT